MVYFHKFCTGCRTDMCTAHALQKKGREIVEMVYARPCCSKTKGKLCFTAVCNDPYMQKGWESCVSLLQPFN